MRQKIVKKDAIHEEIKSTRYSTQGKTQCPTTLKRSWGLCKLYKNHKKKVLGIRQLNAECKTKINKSETSPPITL